MFGRRLGGRGIGGAGGNQRGGSGTYVFVNSEAAALVARFTSNPTNSRKYHIDTLVGSLKTAGVWTKLDALYVMAAHDAQAAQRNWVADAFNLTPTNAPTFAADRGYTGDGTTSYLDTGCNPTTAVGLNYVLDSAHLGVWSRTDVNNSAQFDIGTTNARLNARSSSANTMRGLVNANDFDNYGTNATSIGHFVINRSGSAAQQGYHNGAAHGSNTRASSLMNDANIRVLGAGVNLQSTRQLATAHFGGSLTATEVGDLHDAINTYMTAVGAA